MRKLVGLSYPCWVWLKLAKKCLPGTHLLVKHQKWRLMPAKHDGGWSIAYHVVVGAPRWIVWFRGWQ